MRIPAQQRPGETQCRFRSINDWIVAALGRVGYTRDVATIICECSNSQCVQLLDVSISEYVAVRDDPVCFILARGHLSRLEDRLVGPGQGAYEIVATFGEAAETARNYYAHHAED